MPKCTPKIKALKTEAVFNVDEVNTTQTEATVARLERIIAELNEVAGYFEDLGLADLTKGLDDAADKVENVAEILDTLLGRVELLRDRAKAA